MSSDAVFGIPNDIIIADGIRGGFQLLPQEYQVSYSCRSFTQVSITGIMGRSFNEGAAPRMLADISLLELMTEVSRRIKAGENKQSPMKKKAI